MLKLLLQIVTCNQWPKPKKAKTEELNFPLVDVEDDSRQYFEAGPIKDFYIYADTLMGEGGGKKECQDTFTIQHRLTPTTHIFAVYDGHGVYGKQVSEFINEQFNLCFRINAQKIDKLVKMNCMEEFFKRAFRIIENSLQKSRIDSFTSGSCCNIVLVSGGKCYIANLGDSRAILCRQDDAQNYKVIDLSNDHKPTRPDERERIIRTGGIIDTLDIDGEALGPPRVWTKEKDVGIAMTRAMGDKYGKQAGLISEPEVTEIPLKTGDRFIVTASDGIWDVMTSKEVVDFIVALENSGKSRSQIPRELVIEAEKRWSDLEEDDEASYRDDITVVIAYPEFYLSKTVSETPSSSVMHFDQQ